MVPASPQNDLKRIRKNFLVTWIFFWGIKHNKLKKKKSKLEPFFDSTSFFKDFFFKAGDLSSETVSPAAPEPDLYPNRWTPLREQNRQLKQDLQAKEEEFFFKQILIQILFQW